MKERPLNELDAGSNLTPEARRRQAQRWRDGLQERIRNHAGPGTRFFTVVRRVWTGAYYDGFIHAGNLAYMAILALFPFFIAVAAILSAIGEQSQREAAINAFITAVPPMVAKVIEPVARDAVAARSGWLLWVGGLFGLWTATSLIETIRDILRRAYGTPATRAFWQYRLGSTGVIFAAVMLLLLALSAQVLISALQEVIAALFPELLGLFDTLVYSRLVSAAILFGSIYLLFISLSPEMYKGRAYPKWPGALLVTLWWVAVMLVLPPVLRTFFTYDLTYGSLAGVMIALFFFWLVGLGMVVGAELNAALTETPEERDMLGRYGGGEAQQGENGQGNGE